MIKWTKIFITFVFASVFFASCNNDDSVDSAPALGAYSKGTFVLNEGTSSKGTITFISDSGVIEQDVYTKVNPLAPALGGYLQSMFLDESRAFIVSGSGIITVVNRLTFQHIATITSNLSNPRYGAVINGKAYVTNSASLDNSDDFLTIINLSDYGTSQVSLNKNSEKVLAADGKLFISNGYFGTGNSVTPFNVQTNTSEASIVLGFSAESLQEENNVIYILGANKLAKLNPSTNTLIGEIQTLPVAQTDARNLLIKDGSLYYTFENGVYKSSLSENTFPTAPLFSYSPTSGSGVIYGLAVKSNQIYIADSGDYASDSSVYQYSLNGILQNSFKVGIAPNGFYFN